VIDLKTKILEFWQKEDFSTTDRELFDEFLASLENGTIRAAEKIDGSWQVNSWVKKGILTGFKIGKNIEIGKYFRDKDTYPIQNLQFRDDVRLVPGGSAVRRGSFIGKNVILMPPVYVNTGAYVDSGSMLDSHALVGSCAQVGKNVHLSAAAQLGGVLEPISAKPVIIEDNVFIGGNCGIYEGVEVHEYAVLAAGVIITASTKIYDSTKKEFLPQNGYVPAKAVVVPGSRPLHGHNGFSTYCPIIIKYRDEKTSSSVALENSLR
jgi:2,3,4,5-tetrahydropyridine-2-carboxylate N-succinyltransferase